MMFTNLNIAPVVPTIGIVIQKIIIAYIAVRPLNLYLENTYPVKFDIISCPTTVITQYHKLLKNISGKYIGYCAYLIAGLWASLAGYDQMKTVYEFDGTPVEIIKSDDGVVFC